MNLSTSMRLSSLFYRQIRALGDWSPVADTLPRLEVIGCRKVRASRDCVALFNARWPCSALRSSRAYWFEFDDDGNLNDFDVPPQDDGPSALALAEDCRAFLFDDIEPDWLQL